MLKSTLAKALLKRLEEENFKFHRRVLEEPTHYGSVEEGNFVPDVACVEENWDNKHFINWLLNIGEKEISDSAEEINNILK